MPDMEMRCAPLPTTRWLARYHLAACRPACASGKHSMDQMKPSSAGARYGNFIHLIVQICVEKLVPIKRMYLKHVFTLTFTNFICTVFFLSGRNYYKDYYPYNPIDFNIQSVLDRP